MTVPLKLETDALTEYINEKKRRDSITQEDLEKELEQ
jgi:hypothetical protein